MNRVTSILRLQFRHRENRDIQYLGNLHCTTGHGIGIIDKSQECYDVEEHDFADGVHSVVGEEGVDHQGFDEPAVDFAAPVKSICHMRQLHHRRFLGVQERIACSERDMVLQGHVGWREKSNHQPSEK